MEPESSLLHLQVPATCPYPEHLNLSAPWYNSVKQYTETLDLCNVRSFSFQKWILTATTAPKMHSSWSTLNFMSIYH